MEFFPAPGTTPPCMPKAVVFPPASPVCESGQLEDRKRKTVLEGRDEAYDDGDLAVSRHEWGYCKSKNENVGEHFEVVFR